MGKIKPEVSHYTHVLLGEFPSGIPWYKHELEYASSHYLEKTGRKVKWRPVYEKEVK